MSRVDLGILGCGGGKLGGTNYRLLTFSGGGGCGPSSAGELLSFLISFQNRRIELFQ